MKACPFCAEEIQDAAIKCKHCGEFLEPGGPGPDETKRKNLSKQLGTEGVGRITYLCGFCHLPCIITGSLSDGKMTCGECNVETTYRLRRVRSKSSRQQSRNKAVYRREISLRLLGPAGDEEHLQISTTGGDLEAKSGDVLLFVYYQEALALVRNATVGGLLIQAYPLPTEIQELEKKIAALRPPATAAEANGCALGCIMWGVAPILGMTMDGGGLWAWLLVALGLVPPAAGMYFAQKQPPTAEALARHEESRPVQERLEKLLRLRATREELAKGNWASVMAAMEADSK